MGETLTAAAVRRDRDVSVDVAKGIGILLVVLGHTKFSWVSTFHMPFFFLLSGYFLTSKLPMKEYARRRVRQVLVPYLFGVLFTILFAVLIDLIKGDTALAGIDAKNWIFAGLYGKGTKGEFLIKGITKIGAYWFLLAMFTGSLIARKFVDSKYMLPILAAVAYIGYATRQLVFLPWSIQAGMVASLYLGIGAWSRRHELLKKPDPAILVFCVLLWAFALWQGAALSMVNVKFHQGLLNIAVALAASYVVYWLSALIAGKTRVLKRILGFFGENSLVFYFWHALEINVLKWNHTKALLEGIGIVRDTVWGNLALFAVRAAVCAVLTLITLQIKPMMRIVFGTGGKKPAKAEAAAGAGAKQD